jgi:hypothetical protein
MNKIRFFLVFAVFLAFGFAVLAQEESVTSKPKPEPQFTKVDGNSTEVTFREHGDSIVGGFSGTKSDGGYKGEDFCDSFGSSTANGIATGFQILGPNSAFSTSEGKASSSAKAKGTKTSIDVSGFSEQLNFVEVTDPNGSYADAFNYTNSKYDGDLSGNHPISGSGLSDSIGGSSAFTAETSTSRSAASMTNGLSVASIDIPGKTSVSGIGGTDAFSVMEGPGFYGGAASIGSEKYNGYGTQSIAGTLNGASATHVEISPNSVKASSATSSAASIKPCGTGPCD